MYLNLLSKDLLFKWDFKIFANFSQGEGNLMPLGSIGLTRVNRLIKRVITEFNLVKVYQFLENPFFPEMNHSLPNIGNFFHLPVLVLKD